MNIVIRIYRGRGVKQLFDIGEQHAAELQARMRSIPDLVSYTLSRDSEGGFSVTVCETKRSLNQSIKTARAFLTQHAPKMTVARCTSSRARSSRM